MNYFRFPTPNKGARVNIRFKPIFPLAPFVVRSNMVMLIASWMGRIPAFELNKRGANRRVLRLTRISHA